MPPNLMAIPNLLHSDSNSEFIGYILYILPARLQQIHRQASTHPLRHGDARPPVSGRRATPELSKSTGDMMYHPRMDQMSVGLFH